jgi:hypothetical protein
VGSFPGALPPAAALPFRRDTALVFLNRFPDRHDL